MTKSVVSSLAFSPSHPALPNDQKTKHQITDPVVRSIPNPKDIPE